MLTRPARDVEPSRVVDAVEHGMRTTVGGGRWPGAAACLSPPLPACCMFASLHMLTHYRCLNCPLPMLPLSALICFLLPAPSPPPPAPSCLQGYNEFSLLSLSCSDYLSLPSVGIQIKNRLKDENIALSLPSQVRAVSTPTEQG